MYAVVRLMGRATSHITLECALQTHPNITLIGEEYTIQFIFYFFKRLTNYFFAYFLQVASKKLTEKKVTYYIADVI